MMKSLLFLVLVAVSGGSAAQSVSQKLAGAYQQFMADDQLKYASVSLYVIDASTGEVVFDRNGRMGLAPASTQKIITSVTAFELLGEDYRFKTVLAREGEVRDGQLNGNLYVLGGGDPSFGSWRYENTREEVILDAFSDAIKNLGIRRVRGNVWVRGSAWQEYGIPDGWIWQDIGNYYGAGARGFNWRENQYDLVLASGDEVGDPVRIISTRPALHDGPIISELKAAPRNTGDNAYIYLPEQTEGRIVRGSIPAGQKSFTISGALTDPAGQFAATLREKLGDIFMSPAGSPDSLAAPGRAEVLYTHYSPRLDSIIYWFNRKSINLYGEALVQAMAHKKEGVGDTRKGIALLRAFWKEKMLDENELNMYDGSGLSPLNRVTTHAQVEILKYARSRPWYGSFFEALPEFNHMKMKSGTISDVKGFCGYHKAANGKEYIFSFIVNNYNGKSSQLVSKMYKVLDLLK